MARYKGKRETQREPQDSGGLQPDVSQGVGDPFAEEQIPPVGDPFAEERTPPVGDPFAEERIPPVGDPFAEEDAPPKAEEPDPFEPEPERAATREKRIWEAFREKFLAFAGSRRGKIILPAAGCLLVAVIALAVFLRSWVRRPDIPSGPSTDALTQQNQGGDGPTEDELYPDDGFNGDMPTVSGDRKEGVYTFLLVGTDRGGGNTDTIMVASYDTENQAASVMSIPRDTMINASWDIKKINSVYSRSSDGIGGLMTQVSRLIGFKPDFYVKVDLEMFVKLVDLVGGVDFYVPQDMNYEDKYQDLYIHLKEGQQVLDGEKAMELVRFRRYSEGDIKRVQVQQDFLKALIKKCLSLENWGKIKAYIDLAVEYVQLSPELDYGNIVWFAAQALGLGDAPALSMDGVYTCTIPGDYWGGTWSRATGQNQSYVTIYPSEVVKLVNERFNPYQQNVTTGMLDAMSILSNGNIASSTGNLRDTQHNAIMAVRRGEAYYDENGKIVYGTKPQKPEVKQDEAGNYYIVDADGNVVYTDAAGNPLPEGGNPSGGDNPGEGGSPGGGDNPDEGGSPGGGGNPDEGGQPGGGDNPGEGSSPSGGDNPSEGGQPGGEPGTPEEPPAPSGEGLENTPPPSGDGALWGQAEEGTD